MNQRNDNRMGPVGQCVCPSCKHRAAHRQGQPCREQLCPECGKQMVREGGWHDRLIREHKEGREK
jgi:hypothetical protein